MNLAKKFFQVFSLVSIVQIAVLLIWATYKLNSDKFSDQLINDLTTVQPSILESIYFQNKLGNDHTRDLIAYKLLELNHVNQVSITKSSTFENYIKLRNLTDCTNFNNSFLCSNQSKDTAVGIIPIDNGNPESELLILERSILIDQENVKRIVFLTLSAVFAVFIFNIIAAVFLWFKFLKPQTEKIVEVIKSGKKDESINLSEYSIIQETFLDTLNKVTIAEIEKRELEKQTELISLATQVAHDIRSPLEMLKSLKNEMGTLPKDVQKDFALGINRFEEVAYNLLSKSNNNKNDLDSNHEIVSMIQELIIEKNVEYRKRLTFSLTLLNNDIGYFSSVDSNLIKTILSNLINNSVEAASSERSLIIKISVSRTGPNLMIDVVDNGEGISKNHHLNLFNKGFSTKKTGNGIGLYNAKTDLLKHGGDLSFKDSEIGSTFTISIPESTPNTDFISRIDVSNYKKIIILDDDVSFHKVWRKVLRNVSASLEFYSSIVALNKEHGEVTNESLLLSDFELNNESQTGLEFIMNQKLQGNSYLVTARASELEIKTKCALHKIKLIAKDVIQNLEIFQRPSTIVLIDDDKLMHINWKRFSEKNGYNLLTFFSINEFIKERDIVSKDTLIFIDSDLGDGLKGEVESERLFMMGHRNLYISTGYSKDSFLRPDWIKDVFGKNPKTISLISRSCTSEE